MIFISLGIKAQGILFVQSDSVRVVGMLRKAIIDKPDNLMLYYGHQFINVPYVAQTLEISTTEKLIINLRGLDCSTFVETVMALSMTTKQRSTEWQDYCKNLALIRYRNGKVEGYASRNHYFHWWVENNLKKGLVTLPEIPMAIKKRQILDLSYMTSHVNNYRMLRDGGAKVKSDIRNYEKASFGKVMYYIPASQLGNGKDVLTCIKDGDILAMVTKRHGLDTSHIGIAEWGSDGKLHLLNASKIHKKVVLEPRTLQQYMATQRLQQGVWVIRAELNGNSPLRPSRR